MAARGGPGRGARRLHPRQVLLPAPGEHVIDVPALGVADWHRDLALAHRELDGDVAAWERFLAAYGLTERIDELL